jgi:hypothetical protein
MALGFRCAAVLPNITSLSNTISTSAAGAFAETKNEMAVPPLQLSRGPNMALEAVPLGHCAGSSLYCLLYTRVVNVCPCSSASPVAQKLSPVSKSLPCPILQGLTQHLPDNQQHSEYSLPHECQHADGCTVAAGSRRFKPTNILHGQEADISAVPCLSKVISSSVECQAACIP